MRVISSRFVLVVLTFELRASRLLGKHSITRATPSALTIILICSSLMISDAEHFTGSVLIGHLEKFKSSAHNGIILLLSCSSLNDLE
jgi:hypothetical protein